MSKRVPATVRFSRWAVPIEDDPTSQRVFCELFSRALNREVKVVFDPSEKVDIGVE